MMSSRTAPPGETPVSVVVLTYMEEANLETCLRSVAGWSTDIHVVDSGSTDRTMEIARQFAHNMHQHAYVDHSTQIAFVLATLPIQNEWLLILDADHRVTERLKESIRSMLVSGAPRIDLFYCRQT